QRDWSEAVAGGCGGEIDIAAAIRGHVLEAEECLPLPMTAWIGNRTSEELDAERVAGGAVERPQNRGVRGGSGRGGQHREILQIIGAGIGIARVIVRDAEAVLRPAYQVNPERGVGENGIAENTPAGSRRYANARSAVEGDDVASAGYGPAHR